MLGWCEYGRSPFVYTKGAACYGLRHSPSVVFRAIGTKNSTAAAFLIKRRRTRRIPNAVG